MSAGRVFSRIRLFTGLIFSLSLCCLGQANAQEVIEVGPFSKATTDAVFPEGWVPLNLGGAELKTQYSLVKDAAGWVVRADSHNAASAMFYPIKIDLKKTPIVEWRWKIKNILKQGDATRRDGDDYPARFYIFFDYDPSRLSWFEKLSYEAYYKLYGAYPPLAALNYLWANKLPVGTLVPNIYSDRVQMYALQSGEQHAGKWMVQTRNIYEDYLRAFGEEPPAVLGVAIMTDTDNTGEQATAFYGDIRLLPSPE